MIIKNLQEKEKYYACNKSVADELQRIHKIPLLSFGDGIYYFAITEELKKALKEINTAEEV